MKNKCFFWMIGLGCLSASVLALEMHPYVGLDAQVRFMPFAEGYGRNLIKKKYPQSNLYAGVRVGQFFGLEMGYERAKNKMSGTLQSGSFFGATLPPGAAPMLFNVSSRISGVHASLTGTVSLSESYHVSLIGSAGLGYLKAKTIFNDPDLNLYRIFEKKKWVPKASVGLQKMLTPHAGVRTTLTWEKTSNFNRMAPVNVPTSPLRASIKNSAIFGLGAFYKF